MDEISLKSQEIDDIFKHHLKIESKVLSIESLFSNKRLESKINYQPYYQRNYVWDNAKATYFIESILLGTEIPPLVFFNNQKTIEIIDGRQRFETIKNFISKKFTLAKTGLDKLKFLASKDFDRLEEFKELFWDTKIRIIEFSVVNEPRLDDKKEDKIKKEIFRRYNSGITPLKNPEIEKAVYIDDELTQYFKTKFKINTEEYGAILQLFFTERDIEAIEINSLDKVMSKIRHLLVLHNIPIKKYSSLSGRNDIIKKFYDLLSNNMEDVDIFYKKFNDKIKININLKQILNEKKSDLLKNRLVYECTFWMLTILEAESKNISLFNKNDFISKYADYLIVNNEKFSIENSHFYRNVNERYDIVAKYFERELNLNIDIYLDDYSVYKDKLNEANSPDNPTEEITKLGQLRLNKPEPSSMTIEDICRQMNRDKFLVRPSYQRSEVINKTKSSALIESILLGIKLPPIFIYKRIDGIYEVVDGQQRILSILGFIGEGFLDENGMRVKSEKNNFKLNSLRILSELNGETYSGFDDDLKGKILDFNLSFVIIDAKINPGFDKIDLFIRLNNKPYPIKDDSFEMWNSYIDKEIISTIKENTSKNSSWFYLKTREYNTRMANEELYTTLAYLEYRRQDDEQDKKNEVKYLQIYPRENNINLRIKEKPDITKILTAASDDTISKNKFIKCIKNVESFIGKVKAILLTQDAEELDEYLKKELNNLFYTDSNRRTTQSFYSLWVILNGINMEMVRKYRTDMKEEITNIFKSMKNVSEENIGLNNYNKFIKDFKDKYAIEIRKTKLTQQEKENLISKQNNTCPICSNSIYIGDDIEVDHVNPLALGGRDGFLNLQIAHKECNRKKRINIIN